MEIKSGDEIIGHSRPSGRGEKFVPIVEIDDDIEAELEDQGFQQEEDGVWIRK
jgi:transcription termination factor Rho